MMSIYLWQVKEFDENITWQKHVIRIVDNNKKLYSSQQSFTMADNNLAKVFATEDFNPEKCELLHVFCEIKNYS